MNLGTFKLGAIMAAVFAVGIGGTYFGMEQFDDSNALVSKSAGNLMGHVTATVYGPDGDIKAYRQSDNNIVEFGMEMIASQLFEGINGTDPNLKPQLIAQAGGVNPIDAIGIGTTAAPVTLLSTDTTIGFNGCNNQTVGWTLQTDNGTQNGATSNLGVAMVGINGTATFGPLASCVGTYTEAGAFDNDTSAQMFARNTYTAVGLTAVDSLVINWNFQFDDS